VPDRTGAALAAQHDREGDHRNPDGEHPDGRHQHVGPLDHAAGQQRHDPDDRHDQGREDIEDAHDRDGAGGRAGAEPVGVEHAVLHAQPDRAAGRYGVADGKRGLAHHEARSIAQPGQGRLQRPDVDGDVDHRGHDEGDDIGGGHPLDRRPCLGVVGDLGEDANEDHHQHGHGDRGRDHDPPGTPASWCGRTRSRRGLLLFRPSHQRTPRFARPAPRRLMLRSANRAHLTRSR